LNREQHSKRKIVNGKGTEIVGGKGTVSPAPRGFRRVVAWLLGFATICVLFGGLLVVFFPNDVNILGVPGPYPPIIGWLALATATLIVIFTTGHWVKALPGILMLAAFNGLLAVGTGHLTNAPDVPISRLAASIITFLLIASTVLSFTFKSRGLNWVDQIALLAVVFALAWGVLDEPRAFLSFGTVLFALLFAWLCDRLDFHIPPVPWARRRERPERR
jgi:hypothetical protein